MADSEERPFNPFEGMTFAGELRKIAKRAGGILMDTPREILTNYADMGHEATRAMPGIGPALRTADFLRQFARDDDKSNQERVVSPSPMLTHSQDRGVQVAAAALDPMNWAGAGIVRKGAAKLAEKAGEVVENVVPSAIRRMGASKESREASAARRAADKAELEAPVREAPRSAEDRAAVAPDKYRQLYDAKGEQAVIDAAKAGEHIRPDASGSGLIGFPRDVSGKLNRQGSNEDIKRMRNSLDKQLGDAKAALTYAEDPARVGNWYDRARAGIRETSEPYMMNRVGEQHGTFSAGVAPESENIFTHRHHLSRALGAPERGFRGAQQTELDEAVAQGRAASLRFKIGEYRNKNDWRKQQGSPFGTNDFRSAQEFNYTDAQGKPWKAGVSDTMHPVMDAERALVVDRARKRGDTAMKGEIAQEYPWVLGKAEDFFLQGKFAGANDTESKVNALREANKSTADYNLPKQAGSLTAGHAPGIDTGHRPDILGMSFEDQRKNTPQWGRAATGDDIHARDKILAAMNVRQMPPVEGVGSWMGQQEPVTIARPITYPKVGSVMEWSPSQNESFKGAEMFRGLVGGQSAVAGNLPVTLNARAGKNNVLLERMGMNDAGNPASHLPSREEMATLERVAAKHNYMVTPTGRGALMIPNSDVVLEGARPKKSLVGPMPGENVGEEQLMRAFKKNKGMVQAQASLPGSTAKQAGKEGFYADVVPEERLMGKGIATGRVIKQLARAPAEVARNLSESDEIRSVIKSAHKTDADAAAAGAKVSDALQKSRQFLAEKDWNKVVELVRRGYKVPAAMAALGYSLSGMAADPEARR